MKKINLIKNATLLGFATLFTMSAAQADYMPGSANLVPLLQALETAKAGAAVYPMQVELERGMGGLVYEIEMLSDSGQALMALVNAQTGVLLSTPGMAFYQDYEDQMENAFWLKGIKGGTIKTLEAAVAQAETQYSAKVIEVELEMGYGGVAYEMNIIAPNGMGMEVYVNGSIGGVSPPLPMGNPAIPAL